MKAMVLERHGQALQWRDIAVPAPRAHEILIKVSACGVCRTDLHVIDGDLKSPKLPLVPGHEIVGTVVETGSAVDHLVNGQCFGVPWLGSTCGSCAYCGSGAENLCDTPQFTGYDLDGGYAELTVADAGYCFPIEDDRPDAEIAPLLCAGLIGYRSLKFAGDAQRIGIYGFGAAAHIVAQVARYQGREILAFTRAGDTAAQDFARDLGAAWAGDSTQSPPCELDAAIIFASAGEFVPAALAAVRKGGTVVCGGIHMSDIPSFPYEILWGERVVRSVANLTRGDAIEFPALAPKVPVLTHVTTFPLERANDAVTQLREGAFTGAAVLVPPG